MYTFEICELYLTIDVPLHDLKSELTAIHISQNPTTVDENKEDIHLPLACPKHILPYLSTLSKEGYLFGRYT